MPGDMKDKAWGYPFVAEVQIVPMGIGQSK